MTSARLGAGVTAGWAVALALACTPSANRTPLPTAPDPPRYISAGEAVAWPARPWDARILYGPAPQQFAELRLPDGPGPHPLAAVFHGGCWLSIADNDYMDGVAEAFTAAGWATWNVEFRTLDQSGGAWPGIFQDAAAAMDILREVADDHPIDLDRVVTVGHSSGGHLALWAASRHRIPDGATLDLGDPLPVRGAIGLAAIADLSHYRSMEVPACGDTPTRLVGREGPGAADRTAQASPAELIPTGVPQILFTGVDDYAVPPAHGEAYRDRAVAAGQDVTHHILEQASHFELVAVDGPTWQAVWDRIAPFLERVIAP